METRRALPGEDDHFLLEVYKSSRREEVARWGWSEEQQLNFLNIQYSFQQRSYQLRYPNMESKIIISGGVKAGRLLTDKTGGQMALLDITLLPEFQNKGIGTALLTELQRESRKAGMTLRLSVFTGNPALRLYQRMGFKLVESSGLYNMLEWN